MTRAEFLIQFPEFQGVDDAQIDAFLAAALLEIDLEIWEEKADQGQGYLAAHKLALSPWGNAAEMVVKNIANTRHGNTTYGVHYDGLVLQVGIGAWVA